MYSRMLSIHEKLQTFARPLGEADAPGRSAERNNIYMHMIDLVEKCHQDLTDTERELAADILRQLTRDVEMSLRMVVAERLASDPNAPLDLILMLADDRIEVARSVLTFSAVLSDQHLVEIVTNKAIEHQQCVASRRNLSTRVSSALIATGERSVIRTLLHNMTAHVSPSDYQEILIYAKLDPSLHVPLVQRTDIPKPCLNRLYLMLSYDLKKALNKTFDQSENAASDSLLNRAVDTAVESLVRSDKPELSNIAGLVEKLHDGGQLSAAFLLKCLHQDQHDLFEQAFARLLNVPITIFRTLQSSRPRDGLAVACCAVGIDRSAFLTVYRLTRKAAGLPPELVEHDRDAAYTIFENMDKRKAEITIHTWAAAANRAPIF